MDKENFICGVCSIAYNASDRLPRILISCSHTLCSHCLYQLISTPGYQKCPFDNIYFDEAQDSLDNFPLNYALLSLMENKVQDICQVHDDELTILCLKDKIKICRDCALFGEHKGHPIKKIKEMKAQAIQAKKDLEESLVKFEKHCEEKAQNLEKLKNEFRDKMSDKYEEIKRILSTKELEWTMQIDSLFEKDVDSQGDFLLKKEAEKTLQEIDQACQNDSNLAVLDQDFSSIISRLVPQTASQLSEKTLKTMDCMECFLTNQEKLIKNCDFSNDRQPLNKDKYQQQQQKSSLIDAKTCIALGICAEPLFLKLNNSAPIDLMVDLDESKKIKTVIIKLERYHSLFQDPDDLTVLSEILRQLNNFPSINVLFRPPGLTDERALHLLKVLFCRIQHLVKVEISFAKCDLSDESLLFLCSDILSKASSLRNLILELNFTSITDKSLFALAKSLAPLCKNLETFHLQAEKTRITDEGIEKICSVIEGAKELFLYVKGTGVTDRSLKLLGKNCCMKNLVKFGLDVSETRITMEGVSAVFAGIPKEIKWLNLDFTNEEKSDDIISLFEEKVCPKLGFVEDLHMRLQGKDLAPMGKMSKIVKTIRKEAEKTKETMVRKPYE